MKTIIREIQQPFRRFISGGRDRTMVLACDPEDVVLVSKALEAVEDDPSGVDVLLNFGHAFEDESSFVDQVAALLTLQVEQVNRELSKRGEPVLPGYEPAQEAGRTSPLRLLLGWMRHLSDCLAAERHLAWIFCPAEIGSPQAYAAFFVRLHEESEGLGDRTRVIVRDGRSQPALAPLLEGRPGVRIHDPRVDPDSFQKRIEERANDPALPHQEQAQLHMMLAGADVSAGRFDQARRRNEELLAYFKQQGQEHQESVVLNNLGDLHYLQGDYAEAEQWYARATGLSARLRSAPLLLYQLLNLGNALLAQNRLDEAHFYYQSAAQLGQASHAPGHQIQALEWMGEVERRRGDPAQAVADWEQAAELSRQLGYSPGERSALERLRSHHLQAGNADQARACDRALSQLDGAGSS